MMSLSDQNKQDSNSSNEWIPLDLNAIPHIEDENPLKMEKDTPDYNFFKLIYENSQTGDTAVFKPLVEPDAEHDISYDDISHDFQELFTEDGEKEYTGTKGDFSSDLSSGQIKSDTGLEPKIDAILNGNICEDSGSGSLENSDLASDKVEEKKGYEKGFKQGFDRGKEEGLTQGKAEGEELGYAEGYAKGENDAKKACDAQAGEILSSLEDILLKINNTWTELVKKYENELISLVGRIAEKVVLAKVDVDDQIVRRSILYAMEKIPEPEEISLYVSPEDYEYIEMIKEDFFNTIKGLTSISLESDPSITRGGCRVKSFKAKIETNIESRLEAVFLSIVKAGES